MKLRARTKTTKGEKFDAMGKQVEAITMAVRLNQMISQRANQQIEQLASASANNTSMLNDFQYRVLAMQQLLSMDVKKVQELADTMKLADFDKESIRKDFEGGFLQVDQVESDNDTIILTSATPEETEDRGILRSRMRIGDMNQPDLAAQLMGKKAGDTVETTLNGVKHVITIIAIRRQTPKETQSETVADEKAS